MNEFSHEFTIAKSDLDNDGFESIRIKIFHVVGEAIKLESFILHIAPLLNLEERKEIKLNQ